MVLTTALFIVRMDAGCYSAALRNRDNNLPKDIRAAIKSVYYDWNINVVVEVQTAEGKGYVVYLEDKSQYPDTESECQKEKSKRLMDLDKQ